MRQAIYCWSQARGCYIARHTGLTRDPSCEVLTRCACSQVLKRDREDVDARHCRALLYAELGEHKKAVEGLEQIQVSTHACACLQPVGPHGGAPVVDPLWWTPRRPRTLTKARWSRR